MQAIFADMGKDITNKDLNKAFKEIDANKFEHAKFCAMELYNAVVDGKYEMALSFLRGFRDIFGQSMIDQIRRMYVGKF